eukprot:08725_2
MGQEETQEVLFRWHFSKTLDLSIGFQDPQAQYPGRLFCYGFGKRTLCRFLETIRLSPCIRPRFLEASLDRDDRFSQSQKSCALP